MALSGGFRPVVQLECTFLNVPYFLLDCIVAAENPVRSDIPQVGGLHHRYERTAA